MFRNPVSFTINHSLLFSRLKSEGSITREPFVVHGLTWACAFRWLANADRVDCKVGLCQPSDSAIVCCAVQQSVVIENSGARCHRTLPCALVCQDERNAQWRALFRLWEINLLLDHGRLDVTTHLQVYNPVSFRNLSLTGAYSFCAPVNCVRLVGEQQGTVYVLLNLGQISPDIQEWCIYSFRVFNPQQGITLAGFPVQPKAFLKSWLIREENKAVVTHADYEEHRIRVDIVCVDEHRLETRSYAIPSTDQDLKWSVWWDEHKWIGVASGTRGGGRKTVHHRVWLLRDNGRMELLSELAKTCSFTLPEASKVAKGHFFCIVSSPTRCKGYLFMSSIDHPHIWQRFHLSPYPDFNTDWFISSNMPHNGHLVILTTVTHAQSGRTVLFKLRIEGVVDCFIEPYMVLPQGLPSHYKVEDDQLMCFSYQDHVISMIPIEPQPLKTEAVGVVERLVDMNGRRDGMGILVWEQNWRHELVKKLGNAIANYLW